MIIWSTQAKLQLQDIYDYVYSKSPQNAEMVIIELTDLGENLEIMPYKNPKESTFNNENIRFVPKWNYKIVYRIDPIDIIILSVFNTSQGFINITD